ncbi:MAG: carbonate dehydratase [Acidobacteria bacterium]|nr:carbonate dehydratase [Acidobacteriota bacterium]
MKDIETLLEQNKVWANRIVKEDPQFFEKLADLQNPDFLWIGCSDSRITPTEGLGLLPGEMFVHRNIANLVIYSDMNCLSVIQFAVDVLKVEHIIVCGHYGCGGVKAAYENSRFGLIDNWLRHIQDLIQKYRPYLNAIPEPTKRFDKLCEINIIEQVINAGETTIVQEAWGRGQKLMVHGWIYTIADGIYRDLGVTLDSMQSLDDLRIKMFDEIKNAS